MAPYNRKFTISASAKAVDPSLDALFSLSAKPVHPRKKAGYADLIVANARLAPATPPTVKERARQDEEDESEDEEGLSGDEDEKDDSEKEESASAVEEEVALVEENSRLGKRKRKSRNETDDLESRYLDKIASESAPAEKRFRHSEDLENGEDEKEGEEEDTDELPVHESLLQKDGSTEIKAAGGNGNVSTEVEHEKAARTVFLSNVSIEAVTSRTAKKTLLAHLALPVVGKHEVSGAIESLRFRSVPFATAALPKRAAYITKAVMDATAHATNAYVVYTTEAGARQAVRQLNGSVVLGRHLRADSVVHPAAVDHRRCVFVGNLGFMDNEVVGGQDGEEAKKRYKVPMDVEEGLWRTFGEHAGPVESVRVIRDAATRVGKGFAYVQFVDGTSVEAALLLAGRAFPPMLPRPLRVSRCKAPQKTALAIERAHKASAAREQARKSTRYAPKLSAEQQTQAGRTAKLLGKSAARAGKTAARIPVLGSTEKHVPVFEGMRAKSRQGGLGVKKGRGHKSKGGTSSNEKRRASRAAAWKTRGQKS